MAGFNFAKENLKKIFSIPIYLLLRPLLFFIPRNKNIWVFGSATGKAEGAYILCDYLSNRSDAPEKIIYLVKNKKELTAYPDLPVRFAVKSGFFGFWFTARAGVVIVTHGFGDVNRYAISGAFLVQLWHGVTMKKLHLDTDIISKNLPAPFRVFANVLKRIYELATNKISLFVCASPLAAHRLMSAFALDKNQIVLTGDPRNDISLFYDSNQAKSFIVDNFLKMNSDHSSLWFLYAPTWRDGDIDSSVPNEQEILDIHDFARKNRVRIFIRTHPLAVADYGEVLVGNENSFGVHLLPASDLADINKYLCAFDAVISDYSSIVFDASYILKPVFFFAPDLHEYANSRGLYEPYSVTSENSHVVSWRHLLQSLGDVFSDKALFQAKVEQSKRLRARHFIYHDSGSTGRVLEAIRLYASARWGQDAHPTKFSLHVTAGDTSGLYSKTGSEIIGISFYSDNSKTAKLTVTGISHNKFLPNKILLRSNRSELAADVHSISFNELNFSYQGFDRGKNLSFWQATFTLHAYESFSNKILPPPSGLYDFFLQYNVSGTNVLKEFSAIWSAHMSSDCFVDNFAIDKYVAVCSVRVSGEIVTLQIMPPLAKHEVSAKGRKALVSEYKKGKYKLENMVFFESFYGTMATCNPLAIDAEIARRLPKVKRVWSIKDYSVVIPEGAIAVIDGSSEWFTYRAQAKLLVVNDWLRKPWKAREGQRVFQTWHGSNLKALALSRPNLSLRQVIAIILESRRWDLFLSQNLHTSNQFRKSYAYRGKIIEYGYPRNDVLSNYSLKQARQYLSLDTESKIILYAPTWRDSKKELVDNIGIKDLAKNLGDDWIIMVRAHSRTLSYGKYESSAQIIDVSNNPRLDMLILASDIVVTDYSSIMFDASVANKSMIFYVPDLKVYRDKERGFTFDFENEAPGSLVDNMQDLLAAIENYNVNNKYYEKKYVEWRNKFNSNDRGNSAIRVVDELIDLNYI